MLQIDKLFAPEVAAAIKTLIGLTETLRFEPDSYTAQTIHNLICEIDSPVWCVVDQLSGGRIEVRAGADRDNWHSGIESVVIYAVPGGWQ